MWYLAVFGLHTTALAYSTNEIHHESAILKVTARQWFWDNKIIFPISDKSWQPQIINSVTKFAKVAAYELECQAKNRSTYFTIPPTFEESFISNLVNLLIMYPWVSPKIRSELDQLAWLWTIKDQETINSNFVKRPLLYPPHLTILRIQKNIFGKVLFLSNHSYDKSKVQSSWLSLHFRQRSLTITENKYFETPVILGKIKF